MQNALTIAGLAVGILISIVGVITTIFNFRISRQGLAAKVDVDKATQAKIAAEAAKINKDREREREKFWQEQMARHKERCRNEKSELKLEVRIYQTHIDRIQMWVWGAIRALRLNGIEYENPPDLTEIRQEITGKAN